MDLTRRAVVGVVGAASQYGYGFAAEGGRRIGPAESLPASDKAPSRTIEDGAVTPESLGAIGNGKTDDTAALQSALDSGASRVVCRAGAVYLVSRSGWKTVNLWKANYCLSLPAGVELDLNGSTIRLADGANACVVVAGGQDDRPVVASKLQNGVIDGNRNGQTYTTDSIMPCIYMQGCRELVVDSVTVREARDYCGFFVACVNSRFTNLSALGSDGQGWEFGTAARSQQLVNCFIDNIYGERCTGLRSNTQPGNPATFTLVDCVVGNAIGRNCGAGFKIEANTRNVAFGQLVFDGSPVGAEPAYGTLNSGTKIQGGVVGGVTMTPQGVSIGAVISSNCAGTGLYLELCRDCSVGNYHGTNNGIGAKAAAGDVWLGGARCRIGSIISRGCRDANHAIYVRSYAIASHMETIRVVDCHGCAINVECAGLFTYGTIDAEDGGHMTFVLRIAEAKCQGGGGLIKSSPPLPGAARLAMTAKCRAFFIGPVMMSDIDPIVGTVMLESGATKTVVANSNCHRVYQGHDGAAGRYLQPLVEITPLTAEAQVVSIEFVDSGLGFGFALRHAERQSAQEAVQYRIVGWANV